IETVSDDEAFQMARRLGRDEGVCVGISAGANVVVAKRVAARLGEGKRVVTILCDTGERYFSMEQFFEA
ncbi:MAG: pyridoxal-phosphate dependent enzyme, partial [Candidatus Omnitrophica bacterium]|nr:pyridoxal-phosphate dependent enzyme [Candidatus Omnitrophota bacterium]